MYGLIDCNNFFVSCERVFRPDLVNKPVVVMSNNDGCAVAMSNEAKALGIKRGVPVYQIRQLIKAHNVATLSGNHRLYGDMSSRVMATISSIVPEIEVYSIDECFINFLEYPEESVEQLGRQIVKRVRRDVGIPTSLGIAPTKTLAKIAARFAKKFPGYRAVCVIDTDEKRRKALELTEITDVWGIGRRLGKRLTALHIDNALKFAEMPRERIRQIMNVTGERTWRELNGIDCIDREPDDGEQKQMCCTRSFAEMLFDIDAMRRAVAYFCDNLGRKLRERKLCALTVGLFIQTNAHRQDMPQYYGNTYTTLEVATNDTIKLTQVATSLLYKIYREGYGFKRAGVMITELVPDYAIQQSLFAKEGERLKSSRLMSVIDKINSSDSSISAVHLASMTSSKQLSRHNEQSPFYSTRLSDIITVNTKKR